MRFVANGNGAGPSGGGSLGDRLGLNGPAGFGKVAQAGKHGYGDNNMYATPEPGAVYDPVSSPAWPSPLVRTTWLTAISFALAQNVIDWDKHTIVGTSTKLEKPYLRLTEVCSRIHPFRLSGVRWLTLAPLLQVPNPANIRPLHILKQTLDLLKRKWSTEQNYAYICDQFQSLRQDLTVSSAVARASGVEPEC